MVMFSLVLVDQEEKTALEGHSEEHFETTADQPGDLGGPRRHGEKKWRQPSPFAKQTGSSLPKPKGETRKSQVPYLFKAINQLLPISPRCQRTFRARIGLVGHLRRKYADNPTTPISSPILSLPETPQCRPPQSPMITLPSSRRHRPPCANPFVDRSDQLRQHHDISHSAHRWDDVRRPIIS
nr:unnamed protein product [Spirometra erinaceieuropaei]